MGRLLSTHDVRTAQQQAAFYHSRQRMKQQRGFPTAPITHRFAIPTATIAASLFPDRERPITLSTRIRITENAGVHRGLIFEFGSATRGMAAWVGDQTIGFTAGGLTTELATATWDLGVELQPGREFQLMFTALPGTGRINIFNRGKFLQAATASGGGFGTGGWADSEAGSFASAADTTTPDGVPVASDQAPAGFDVILPLTVLNGYVPTEFF
jgi:hypothetical protein